MRTCRTDGFLRRRRAERATSLPVRKVPATRPFSKRTGHSPVAEPNRPKPSSMRPKRSLARCVGVRVCGTLPQRPLQSRKKTAHKWAGAKTRDSSPFRHRQYRERMAAQGRKPLFADLGRVGGAPCPAAARRVSTGQHSRFGVYHEAADAAMGK